MEMDKLNNKKITIIGAGNMGQAIAQGLLGKKIVSKNQLFLTNSRTKNNKQAVQKSDIVILAIKPQIAMGVFEEIKNVVKDQLIISIIAGIMIPAIHDALGKKVAIVRAMPNLAAKVGESMSVWVKSKEVTSTQEAIAKIILEAVGVQQEFKEENKIDMATALSGSGPAYFFYLAELLEKGAVQIGLSKKEAQFLSKQTLIGSAHLLEKSESSPEELRHAVTSKGGTTEAALAVFQKSDIEQTVTRAMNSAYKRVSKLGGDKK